MKKEYIDSMSDLTQSKEVSITWGIAAEFVLEYKLEELPNEA